jgi:ferritin-like metal-binding protein YciE
MPINEPMDAFVKLLSHVRQTTERSDKIYEELANIAQDPEIKETLGARQFAKSAELAKIDEAFRLIGKKPVPLTGKIAETFVEDFRGEVAELSSPAVKKIFVLAKAIHLAHWRAGEWMALVAAADFTGNYGVGVLLETCLADDLAFAERTRRALRGLAEAKRAARAGS